jgi:hypothetical protein
VSTFVKPIDLAADNHHVVAPPQRIPETPGGRAFHAAPPHACVEAPERLAERRERA